MDSKPSSFAASICFSSTKSFQISLSSTNEEIEPILAPSTALNFSLDLEVVLLVLSKSEFSLPSLLELLELFLSFSSLFAIFLPFSPIFSSFLSWLESLVLSVSFLLDQLVYFPFDIQIRKQET